MSLTLPADLEPYVDSVGEMHRPGAYALLLDRPDDFADEWDRAYDERPPWFDAAVGAKRVCYVGGSGDLLGRLEDHADGDVRTTVLTRVCDIDRLQTVWFDADTEWSLLEDKLARILSAEYPGWYVHAR